MIARAELNGEREWWEGGHSGTMFISGTKEAQKVKAGASRLKFLA